jgi:hypothetical protein
MRHPLRPASVSIRKGLFHDRPTPAQEKLVCFLETLQTYHRLRKRLTDLAREDPKLVLLYTDTLRDHLTELADGGLLAALDEIAFAAMVTQDQANRTAASPRAP